MVRAETSRVEMTENRHKRLRIFGMPSSIDKTLRRYKKKP